MAAQSDEDLAFAGVAALARLLRERHISSVELTELFLGRLERLGPQFNSVASLAAERARREAQRADEALRRETARSALAGIPYGAKDLLAARGAPTTWGAPPYRDQVLDHDAAVVAKLRRAGAVLAAKLAMVELAGGGGYRFPTASLQGPGRTPWNREHWSGGSSSGSGATVAAGLVPWAIGTETSGSIITPAAYCGVTGLRPTYGLVSRRGAMALSWTLDKIGPMARSAEDCALALEVMAGPDQRDDTSAGRRFRHAPLDAAQLREVRLGYAPADFEELPVLEARPVFADALQTVREMGVPLVEATLPSELAYGPTVSTIIAAEGATEHAQLIESDAFESLVDEKQRAGLRAGLAITARAYLEAMRVRTRVQQAFRDLFGRVDVLVSVGRTRGASRIDEPLDTAPPPAPQAGVDGPPRPNNGGLIPAGNLAGLPALCLPCGFTADGLPLAIQLVGPPFSENLLLSLGARFQQETDWHSKRPPALG